MYFSLFHILIKGEAVRLKFFVALKTPIDLLLVVAFLINLAVVD